MNRFQPFDLNTWNRREIFQFYRKFDAPCFNVSVKIKAELLYQYAKTHQESFFLMALYALLRAANAIPQFRRRILDQTPGEFEQIAVMTPIMTRQELFRQIWCEYEETFAAFKAKSAPKIAQAKSGQPAPLENHGDDFFCASCLPWLHFESVAQAEYGFHQAIPILAWGKLEDGMIPVSVKLNHCFIDGLHVARFFETLQHSFTEPESLLQPRQATQV